MYSLRAIGLQLAQLNPAIPDGRRIIRTTEVGPILPPEAPTTDGHDPSTTAPYPGAPVRFLQNAGTSARISTLSSRLIHGPHAASRRLCASPSAPHSPARPSTRKGRSSLNTTGSGPTLRTASSRRSSSSAGDRALATDASSRSSEERPADEPELSAKRVSATCAFSGGFGRGGGGDELEEVGGRRRRGRRTVNPQNCQLECIWVRVMRIPE